MIIWGFHYFYMSWSILTVFSWYASLYNIPSVPLNYCARNRMLIQYKKVYYPVGWAAQTLAICIWKDYLDSFSIDPSVGKIKDQGFYEESLKFKIKVDLR